MKAITLHQPWASLWLTTAKVHETRTWATNHRGELAVHASKRPVNWNLPFDLHCVCVDYLGKDYERTLPLGKIIGIVHLIDCYPMHEHGPIDATDRICGDWNPGRFAWKRGEFLAIVRPIPHVGHQRLWNGPEHILGAPGVLSASAPLNHKRRDT
jgi:activating signal cointegrator 1